MKSTKKKATVKISFWKDILLEVLKIGVIVAIISYIEMACLDTLLPICIRWMYYPFVMCVIFIALETFREHYGKPKKKKKERPFFVFFIYNKMYVGIDTYSCLHIYTKQVYPNKT